MPSIPVYPSPQLQPGIIIPPYISPTMDTEVIKRYLISHKTQPQPQEPTPPVPALPSQPVIDNEGMAGVSALKLQGKPVPGIDITKGSWEKPPQSPWSPEYAGRIKALKDRLGGEEAFWQWYNERVPSGSEQGRNVWDYPGSSSGGGDNAAGYMDSFIEQYNISHPKDQIHTREQMWEKIAEDIYGSKSSDNVKNLQSDIKQLKSDPQKFMETYGGSAKDLITLTYLTGRTNLVPDLLAKYNERNVTPVGTQLGLNEFQNQVIDEYAKANNLSLPEARGLFNRINERPEILSDTKNISKNAFSDAELKIVNLPKEKKDLLSLEFSRFKAGRDYVANKQLTDLKNSDPESASILLKMGWNAFDARVNKQRDDALLVIKPSGAITEKNQLDLFKAVEFGIKNPKVYQDAGWNVTKKDIDDVNKAIDKFVTDIKTNDPEGYKVYRSKGYESYLAFSQERLDKFGKDLETSDPKGYRVFQEQGYEGYLNYNQGRQLSQSAKLAISQEEFNNALVAMKGYEIYPTPKSAMKNYLTGKGSLKVTYDVDKFIHDHPDYKSIQTLQTLGFDNDVILTAQEYVNGTDRALPEIENLLKSKDGDVSGRKLSLDEAIFAVRKVEIPFRRDLKLAAQTGGGEYYVDDKGKALYGRELTQYKWDQLTEDEKRKAAGLFGEDKYKDNYFAEYIHRMEKVSEKGGLIANIIYGPGLTIASPIAKASTGQEVTPTEWLNMAVMSALTLAMPINSIWVQITALAVAEGVFGTQYVQNFGKMTTAERGVYGAILVLPFAKIGRDALVYSVRKGIDIPRGTLNPESLRLAKGLPAVDVPPGVNVANALDTVRLVQDNIGKIKVDVFAKDARGNYTARLNPLERAGNILGSDDVYKFTSHGTDNIFVNNKGGLKPSYEVKIVRSPGYEAQVAGVKFASDNAWIERGGETGNKIILEGQVFDKNRQYDPYPIKVKELIDAGDNTGAFELLKDMDRQGLLAGKVFPAVRMLEGTKTPFVEPESIIGSGTKLYIIGKSYVRSPQNFYNALKVDPALEKVKPSDWAKMSGGQREAWYRSKGAISPAKAKIIESLKPEGWEDMSTEQQQKWLYDQGGAVKIMRDGGRIPIYWTSTKANAKPPSFITRLTTEAVTEPYTRLKRIASMFSQNKYPVTYEAGEESRLPGLKIIEEKAANSGQIHVGTYDNEHFNVKVITEDKLKPEYKQAGSKYFDKTGAEVPKVEAVEWAGKPDGTGQTIFGDFHGKYGDFKNLVNYAYDYNILEGPEGSLRWNGSHEHVSLAGDISDRGPHTLKLWKDLLRLQDQAAKTGGKVDLILGNHDLAHLTGEKIPGIKYDNARYEKTLSDTIRKGILEGKIKAAAMTDDGGIITHAGISLEQLPEYKGKSTDYIVTDLNKRLYDAVTNNKFNDKIFNQGWLDDGSGAGGIFWYRPGESLSEFTTLPFKQYAGHTPTITRGGLTWTVHDRAGITYLDTGRWWDNPLKDKAMNFYADTPTTKSVRTGQMLAKPGEGDYITYQFPRLKVKSLHETTSLIKKVMGKDVEILKDEDIGLNIKIPSNLSKEIQSNLSSGINDILRNSKGKLNYGLAGGYPNNYDPAYIILGIKDDASLAYLVNIQNKVNQLAAKLGLREGDVKVQAGLTVGKVIGDRAANASLLRLMRQQRWGRESIGTNLKDYTISDGKIRKLIQSEKDRLNKALELDNRMNEAARTEDSPPLTPTDDDLYGLGEQGKIALVKQKPLRYNSKQTEEEYKEYINELEQLEKPSELYRDIEKEPYYFDPAFEKPIFEKPIPEKPITEKMIYEETTGEKPLLEKPPTYPSIAENPPVYPSTGEKPIGENPITEKLPGYKPTDYLPVNYPPTRNPPPINPPTETTLYPPPPPPNYPKEIPPQQPHKKKLGGGEQKWTPEEIRSAVAFRMGALSHSSKSLIVDDALYYVTNHPEAPKYPPENVTTVPRGIADTGWRSSMPAEKRRDNLEVALKEDHEEIINTLQALSQVTKHPEVARAAKEDIEYFRKKMPGGALPSPANKLDIREAIKKRHLLVKKVYDLEPVTIARKAPYTGQDVQVFVGDTPPGMAVAPNMLSAKKTIQSLSGTAPPLIQGKVGFQDYQIQRPGRAPGSGKISFHPSLRSEKKGQVYHTELGGETVLSRRPLGRSKKRK